ncbi:hypothetical protein F5X97DRAFT_85864 [Nemania serpens]|nr:hypothetical protein F5X97DRAFT_85864 [Nemania serpens]
MCIKSYQHFTKCDHISTTLTTCPTHRKQQKSAEGLFGCLFHRSSRKKSNCGRVFPHHMQNETYCQGCSIKTDRFTVQGVGQGALRVRKQGFQEVFQEERREAGGASLQNSRNSRLNEKDSKHNIIDAENSVWLDDLYRHPETLAKKDAYRRAAALAPPVSSHSRRPREIDSRAGAQQHHREYTRKPETGEAWMPSYGGSQPIMRPTQPALASQYLTHAVNNSPGLPPAMGPPPGQDDYSVTLRADATKGPQLRHKTGRVYNTAKIRNQRLDPPYQAYLDGMRTEAAIRARQHPYSAPLKEPDGPKSCWEEEEPSPRDSKKATLSGWIERTKERTVTNKGSDVSFVCATSHAISNQDNDQSRSKRRRRGHSK